MKTKKIFLMGGMGNQFFQLARASSLKKEGIDVEVLILNRYKNIIYRLLGFSLHEDWININKLCNQAKINSREISFYEIFLLFLILIKKNILNSSENFNQKCFNDNIFVGFEDNKVIDVGYFQSLDHISHFGISHITHSIINTLKLDSKSISFDFIAHIRGGDFSLQNRVDNKNAKDIFDLASGMNSNLIIVTNDINYVDKIFYDVGKIKTFTSENALDDFKLLSQSKNLYLSNSTFSFWAACCSLMLNDSNIFYNNDFEFANLLIKDNLIRSYK